MAIEGYIGPPGSGKTYSMTKRVLEEKRKFPDRPIFANYPIRGAVYFEVDDWIHLPPGLIVIDEAHLLFSARAALRLPGEWLATLSQTRKRGWDIIFSTQHEKRVDSVLRDISDKFWLCEAWGGSINLPPRLFRVRAFEPEDFRKPKKQIETKYHRFDTRVATSYDTLARIKVAKHLSNETIAKAKAEAETVEPKKPAAQAPVKSMVKK